MLIIHDVCDYNKRRSQSAQLLLKPLLQQLRRQLHKIPCLLKSSMCDILFCLVCLFIFNFVLPLEDKIKLYIEALLQLTISLEGLI